MVKVSNHVLSASTSSGVPCGIANLPWFGSSHRRLVKSTVTLHGVMTHLRRRPGTPTATSHRSSRPLVSYAIRLGFYSWLVDGGYADLLESDSETRKDSKINLSRPCLVCVSCLAAPSALTRGLCTLKRSVCCRPFVTPLCGLVLNATEVQLFLDLISFSSDPFPPKADICPPTLEFKELTPKDSAETVWDLCVHIGKQE